MKQFLMTAACITAIVLAAGVDGRAQGGQNDKDKIDRVTFWGVHDGQSWHNYFPQVTRPAYPLLFDRNCQPKPAFFAVIKEKEAETLHGGLPSFVAAEAAGALVDGSFANSSIARATGM